MEGGHVRVEAAVAVVVGPPQAEAAGRRRPRLAAPRELDAGQDAHLAALLFAHRLVAAARLVADHQRVVVRRTVRVVAALHLRAEIQIVTWFLRSFQVISSSINTTLTRLSLTHLVIPAQVPISGLRSRAPKSSMFNLLQLNYKLVRGCTNLNAGLHIKN